MDEALPNVHMRLFGGAQYHRAMAEFRTSIGHLTCPDISRWGPWGCGAVTVDTCIDWHISCVLSTLCMSYGMGVKYSQALLYICSKPWPNTFTIYVQPQKIVTHCIHPWCIDFCALALQGGDRERVRHRRFP